ncbi:MAG: glycoside hydrolase family 16 protein [Spirochaetales bacterium]|nr:glycoside hydrolase family 16 protein [Spirochaetales bacterium]
MKIIVFAILILAGLFLFSTCTTTPKGEWVLTFSDDFDGTGSPSGTKWESLQYNRRNNDAGPDGYWMTDDAYLDGSGHLVIRCRVIPDQNGDGDDHDYSTGMVRSRGKFEQKYGKFEIRCQMPERSGWWVAFWLMSDTVGNVDGSGRDGTEIDIMEGFGWTEKMGSALHWDGYGAEHQSTGQSTVIPGLLEGFHTFTLEWYSSQYVFYVDGNETWRTSAGGVSQVPAYVKISGELSTESWAVNEYWANPQDDANYPDYFIVDWVRVYTMH